MQSISKNPWNLLNTKTMKTFSFFLFPLMLFVFFSHFAQATLFRNSYISFKLPNNWKCSRQGTEWVCKESNKKTPYQAIIVITAKEKDNTMDNLKSYEAYLKKPRQLITKKSSQISTVNHVRQVSFSGHPWVDAMHLSGEIGSYYTRYLVTTHDRIAILLSLSVQKEVYTKYSQIFSNVLKSIKLLSPEESFKSSPKYKVGLSKRSRGSLPLSERGGEGFEEEEELSSESPISKDSFFLFIAFVVLVSIGYFFYSRRKKA